MTDTANAGGQMDNEFAQMGVDPAQYEALEKDFQEVLSELVNDNQMEKFRKEYEKLHRALKTSYESEKRLVKRCKELNDTILQNAARVKGAIKLTQEDSNTIAVLRREIEKCWKLVETAKDKEEKARRIISGLKEEIAKLHKIVEQGSGLSLGQDNTVHKLIQKQEQLDKDVADKKSQIDDLELTKNTLNVKILKLENDVAKEKEEVQKKQHLIDKFSEDQVKFERNTKLFEAQKKNLEQSVEAKEANIKDLEEEKKNKETENDNLINKNEKFEKALNNKTTELHMMNDKYSKLESFNQQLKRENQNLHDKRYQLDIEIGEMRSKIRELEKSNKGLTRSNNGLLYDKDRVTREKKEAEYEKNLTKNGVNALTREIEHLRRDTDVDKKKIIDLIRFRDMMSKSIKKAEDENFRNKDEISKKNTEIQLLKRQAAAKQENIKDLLVQIYSLEKERDRFSHEASKANANLMQMVEEVKLKQNLISELKKENIEFEGKLKQQQNLYEAVRSDRNLYSKNLIEAQDEVAELKRKFKIASHQISQLKDEIMTKDQALSVEHANMAKQMKLTDKIIAESQVWQEKYNTADQIRVEQNAEIEKLTAIIKLSYEEIEKIKKDYQNVINERDILGTQLIRRNDELALLYEKIKILQNTLARGEVQYQERLEDIRLLKFKIGDHKSELRIVKSQASQIPDLRKEIYNLQRQLLTERLQVKALSEELENPLNCHRWRKLEGTDPDTWEMLQKIQTLQKRLIKKTEEVVEKDVIIQEKEKLYVELKNLLARQPGPEVAEQLSIYQQNLKEKTSQMKAMAAELNMYQAQVNEYKYEIERLTRELQDMKRKYYEQKRREQMQREAQQRLEPRMNQGAAAPVQRFTGGGFNLAI